MQTLAAKIQVTTTYIVLVVHTARHISRNHFLVWFDMHTDRQTDTLKTIPAFTVVPGKYGHMMGHYC